MTISGGGGGGGNGDGSVRGWNFGSQQWHRMRSELLIERASASKSLARRPRSGLHLPNHRQAPLHAAVGPHRCSAVQRGQRRRRDGGTEGRTDSGKWDGWMEWGAVTKLCRWHAQLGNAAAAARTRPRAESSWARAARSLSGNKFIRCMKKTQ